MGEKVKLEEKIIAAKEYLSGRKSAKELGEIYEVNRMTILRWAKKYETKGKKGLQEDHGTRYADKNLQYSKRLKEQAVKDYLNGEGSQERICKKYGIRSKTQVQNWIKVYNIHGNFNKAYHFTGGSTMKQGRNTTLEERIEIAKACIAADKNYGETALQYKVSYQQVRTWTLRFEEVGEAGLDDKRGKRKKDQEPRTELEQAQIEIEKLKHQLYLAEMENTLLKKLEEIKRRDAFLK